MNPITSSDLPVTVYIETLAASQTYTISATDTVSETNGNSNFCGARTYSIATSGPPAWVTIDSTSGAIVFENTDTSIGKISGNIHVRAALADYSSVAYK